MPNAITMLKSDHAAVKRLLRELRESGDNAVTQRATLVERIELELKMHSQLEEEIFYPAFKARTRGSDDEEMFYEAAEEHHLVDIVLSSLKTANPRSHGFKAKVKVLKDLIEHHVQQEEGEMFKTARTLFTDADLRQLGEMMQSRKESIAAIWDNPLLRPVKKMQGVAHRLMPTKVKTMKADLIAKKFEREEERR